MQFSAAVFKCLARVPAGTVTTYQALAQAAGRPRAYRAVGTILNGNPNLVVVPCHRVVKSSGEIGSYVAGQEQKIRLLKKEGVAINAQSKIIDLEKYQYTW